MAFSTLRSRPARGADPLEEAQTSRAAEPSAPRTTYLDHGCEFVGRISSRSDVGIGGRVEGEIRSHSCVTVGDTGRVQGNVLSESVVVSGAVDGDIAAQRKITLHQAALVTGDLSTRGIVIEEGARLKGKIVIGSDDGAGAPSASRS